MRLVVDASIALKWVVSEVGSADAAVLRLADQLLAPELIVTECGNALWKKTQRNEMSPDEARLAARAMGDVQLELRPMRNLVAAAVDLALALDHPAYDCFYLALAAREACPLVTADERFLRKVASARIPGLPEVLTLAEAARLVAP